MNIVFLSQRFPLPADTGGKVRTGNLLRQLHRRNRVVLVGNFDVRQDGAWAAEIDSLCSRHVAVPWREAGRWSLSAWRRRATATLAGLPIAAACDHTTAMRRTVEQVCREERPDVLVCDFAFAALNCQAIADTPKVLFQHNVESEIARRHFESARGPLGKLFWRGQWQRTQRLERNAVQQFDVVVGVSERDCAAFEHQFDARCTRPIPPAVDSNFFQPIRRRDPRRLLFFGSLDWLPNADSLRFLLRDVFPRVAAELPGARVRIMGRRAPRWLERIAEKNSRIELVGWTRDVRAFAEESGVFVVPLRIGGGSRVKLLEAVALGIPIVSTSIGAEGLPLEQGRHFLQADSADDFARAIIRLAHDTDLAAQIATGARAELCGHYTWERAGEAFESACAQAIELFHNRACEPAATVEHLDGSPRMKRLPALEGQP